MRRWRKSDPFKKQINLEARWRHLSKERRRRLLKDIRGLLNDSPSATIIAYKTPQAVDEERDLTTREAAKFNFTVTDSPILHLPGPAEPRQFVFLKKIHR